MAKSVPERWRFSLDNEEISLRKVSWADAVKAARETEQGDLAAQSDGECVQCEFNATHAAVLYMGRDGVILRPYLPDRPPAAQDLTPFFCGGCGIQLGPQEEYLARFFDRETGFRLFEAVLCGPPLPDSMPESQPDQPLLPGFEPPPQRPLEWRPLPHDECRRSEPDTAPDHANG
ncbi:MAG TPA: hypothetical protein VH643_22245 [Gemmataceae bacterium]